MTTVPLMNAAGWIKTPELVRKIVTVPFTSHVVAGSFTVIERFERTGGTDFDVRDDGTASNNLNLPNGGMPFLTKYGPEMVSVTHDADKEFVLSGAPFTPEEDGLLAETAFDIGADAYESNRGCPNTESNILSYNHDQMEAHDEAVKKAIGNLPWRRKLSPYVNPQEREYEAELTLKSTARGVVVINAVPNVRLRDRHRKPMITAHGTNGLGGMSGTQIKELALLNAEHFCELLKPTGKTVWGVGGIRSGEDLEDFFSVGCDAAQVAAALFSTEDPKVLQNIGQEWANAYA